LDKAMDLRIKQKAYQLSVPVADRLSCLEAVVYSLLYIAASLLVLYLCDCTIGSNGVAALILGIGIQCFTVASKAGQVGG
jgi:hypothetical protein